MIHPRKSALLLGTAFLLAGFQANAQAPATCNVNQTTGQIAVGPFPPCDYSDTEAITADGLANFAWNTFIALNWPANEPFNAPYDRGVPDQNSTFGAPGPAGQDTPIVVWDSWREKRELYSITAIPGGFAYQAPPAFNDGMAPSTTGPNPAIPMCTTAAPPPAGHITALQTSKVENYLDETDEIGLAVLWAGTDTTSFDEDTIVRYQVKFSYDYYEHVRTNQWWNPPTLNAEITAQQTTGNGIGVVLPSGSNTNAATGTILTKSAWKLLSAAEISAGTYYTQSSLFYETENSEACYNYGTFGLIAVHMIRKTEKFPYYFFSTFEHKGNTPNAFIYANTNGTAAPNQGSPYSSTLPNAFGIAYTDPANPEPNASSDKTPGYNAKRLISALASVNTANTAASSVTTGTVWGNYQLVGLQYKPVDGVAGAAPQYFTDQDYYLANPVIESSQRFQFFEGGFATSGTNNIALYTNNDPTATNPAGGKIDPSVNMGGCMGCHGNGQSTDFSFTLSGATGEPSHFSAETLEEKCGSGGELNSSFDATTGVCTLN